MLYVLAAPRLIFLLFLAIMRQGNAKNVAKNVDDV